MRLASLPLSPIALLVLASACTVDNSAKQAPESGVTAGGTVTGGASNAWGGDTAAGSTVIGGSNSAGNGAAIGGDGFAGSSHAIGNGGSAGSGNTIGVGLAGGGTANVDGGFAGSGKDIGVGGLTGSGNGIGSAGSAGSSTAIGRGGVAGSTAVGRGGSAGSANATGGSAIAAGGTAVGGANTTASGGSGGNTGSAKPLPATTFVFERRVGGGRDHLVAMDCVTREQRIISTLAEGSVEGWGIDGVTVSPDRTRIVIASLYGATAADNATGLATNRLWSLDTDGHDFRRLTPVFPNTHSGQPNWRIDIRDPAYSADGQYIAFDYGEGDFTGGYVAPWVTAADGSSLPSLFDTNLDCSVNGNAAFNPVTGDLLLEHVICIGGQKGGFHLYPSAGGAPDFLVNDDGMSLSSEPPAFSADGAVFVYTGRTYADNIQSLYAYIMSERRVVTLIPGAVGRDIVNASFSPDNTHMVYCIREGDAYDLRVVDFGLDPATDSPLTNDGISCDAVF